MFEFSRNSIVKDNKLRLRVTCQPGVMKQILDGCCWLVCSFNNFKPAWVDWWIYHFCEFRQIVRFGWFPHYIWIHHVHTNYDPAIHCQILLFWVGARHISCVSAWSIIVNASKGFDCLLSLLISLKRNKTIKEFFLDLDLDSKQAYFRFLNLAIALKSAFLWLFLSH
jgi:hypothetical protein